MLFHILLINITIFYVITIRSTTLGQLQNLYMFKRRKLCLFTNEFPAKVDKRFVTTTLTLRLEIDTRMNPPINSSFISKALLTKRPACIQRGRLTDPGHWRDIELHKSPLIAHCDLRKPPGQQWRHGLEHV